VPNCHIGRVVLGSMCVGVSVWMGWSGVRVAGLSLHYTLHQYMDRVPRKVKGQGGEKRESKPGLNFCHNFQWVI